MEEAILEYLQQTYENPRELEILKFPSEVHVSFYYAHTGNDVVVITTWDLLLFVKKQVDNILKNK